MQALSILWYNNMLYIGLHFIDLNDFTRIWILKYFKVYSKLTQHDKNMELSLLKYLWHIHKGHASNTIISFTLIFIKKKSHFYMYTSFQASLCFLQSTMSFWCHPLLCNNISQDTLWCKYPSKISILLIFLTCNLPWHLPSFLKDGFTEHRTLYSQGFLSFITAPWLAYLLIRN